MSKYTSETKCAVSLTAYELNKWSNAMRVEFNSIATAWRFISGYNPIHHAWNGRVTKQRKTTYDALQATLKRKGRMCIELVINDILYFTYLEYAK